MKQFNRLPMVLQVPAQPASRAGATLSEVLISMLVMSIGVVGLATLFPISVLRSVQATQLTNATNLRYNVEAMVGARPSVYTVGNTWQPSVTYPPGSVVAPSPYSSLKYPALVAINNGGAGTSGTVEPNWLATPCVDNSITWTVILLSNYVVDPFGEYIATFDDPNGMGRGPVGGAHYFGNNYATPAFVPSIRAFSGVSFQSQNFGSYWMADEYQAADTAYLPDSWITQAESNQFVYGGGTNVTLNDAKVDLTKVIKIPSLTLPPGQASYIPPAFAPGRIVFFDVTGKVSHVRPILTLTGSPPSVTLDWSAMVGGVPTGPLPASFTPARVRVESLDRRFSWMMSVRRGGAGSSSMDIVVFFKRQYSSKDEQVYPATFQTGGINPTGGFYAIDPGYDGLPGLGGVDDDGDGNIDFVGGNPDAKELGAVGSDDVARNWTVVQYDAAGDKPFYKKGGFVCDANTMRWYRITDVVEGDLINGYTPTAVMQKAMGPNVFKSCVVADAPYGAFTSPRAIYLRLERPIDQSGPVPTAAGPTGGAIFMRGVVEVYPIRAQLAVDN